MDNYEIIAKSDEHTGGVDSYVDARFAFSVASVSMINKEIWNVPVEKIAKQLGEQYGKEHQ